MEDGGGRDRESGEPESSTRSTWPNVAGFADRKGSYKPRAGHPPEAAKGMETNSL